MDIYEKIEKMTDAEKQAVLAADFGEDLEKQAAAEAASEELAGGLYAMGAHIAALELAATEGEELDKTAAEGLAAEGAEIAAVIDRASEDLGIAELEDSEEIAKEATAAAGLMLAGYVDFLEKKADKAEEAKAPGRVKAFLESAGKSLKEKKDKAMAAAKGAAGKAGEHVKAHSGKYGLGAGALLGATAAGIAMGRKKKGLDKKASAELSLDEISNDVIEQMTIAEVMADGVEKLAAAGEEASKKASKLKEMWAKMKGHVGSHKGKYGLGAGMAGGAAAMMAAKKLRSKKD